MGVFADFLEVLLENFELFFKDRVNSFAILLKHLDEGHWLGDELFLGSIKKWDVNSRKLEAKDGIK